MLISISLVSLSLSLTKSILVLLPLSFSPSSPPPCFSAWPPITSLNYSASEPCFHGRCAPLFFCFLIPPYRLQGRREEIVPCIYPQHSVFLPLPSACFIRNDCSLNLYKMTSNHHTNYAVFILCSETQPAHVLSCISKGVRCFFSAQLSSI